MNLKLVLVEAEKALTQPEDSNAGDHVARGPNLVQDKFHQLLHGGFVRRPIESNFAILQQVNPVADVENMGVVVGNENDEIYCPPFP